jgi:hypothetical protein
VSVLVTSTEHVRGTTNSSSQSQFLTAAATMTTIAGPRPNQLPHVGKLVAVTPSHLNKPLKRSSRRPVKSRATEDTLSLRDSYLTASLSADHVLQALNDSSRLAVVQDQNTLVVPETRMAPYFNYQRLSSAPPSPAGVNNSIAANISASGQELSFINTQSGVVTSPVSFLISFTISKRIC